jgi:hypothetical protein
MKEKKKRKKECVSEKSEFEQGNTSKIGRDRGLCHLKKSVGINFITVTVIR